MKASSFCDKDRDKIIAWFDTPFLLKGGRAVNSPPMPPMCKTCRQIMVMELVRESIKNDKGVIKKNGV